MRFYEVKRSRVEITDRLIAAKRQANLRYMMSLDSNALLLNYRSEAILDDPFSGSGFKRHGGWEDPGCQLRGHFTGHWLSAAAMHYASTGDMEIKARADAIVTELGRCQEANGGEWAASIPEKYLERIAAGQRVWAPHYTIHKTFMGLLDMYLFAQNDEALKIAKNWARWFLRWTAKWSREQMDTILDVETGGMLEIWALLYGVTKEKDYLTLMERYYRGRLFDPLLADRDVLTNMHANTTIPEVLGAATAYEVTGEEKWLNIVKAYWKHAVSLRGQYATGGQTSGEVWTPKMELAARLGDKNQEHCAVYNMMRLADFLIRVTGEKQYADYWEQNLYNGILAQGYWQGHFTHGVTSPHPDQGLLTYFLPLRSGGRKGWSSETEDFFCCHGTLVQANASFDRGIYYLIGEDEGLAVCQFFDSSLTTSIRGTELEVRQWIDSLSGHEHFTGSVTGIQQINNVTGAYPHNPDTQRTVLEIVTGKEVSFELKVRIPFWIKGEPVLYINGEKQACKKTDGWISIERNWSKDTVILEFKKGISAWPLPDRPDTAAFLYGPVVLAGLCDEEIRLEGDISSPEKFIVHDNEREWGMWMNTFKTSGQAKNIRMVPLYQIGYDPYTVYFPVS
ncbi:glycosyl hydrolase [Spirochaetia bacterium]|nr:glycosyl hydrolase [Spirochaetia bacterium]